jgi:hypothetical protein
MLPSVNPWAAAVASLACLVACATPPAPPGAAPTQASPTRASPTRAEPTQAEPTQAEPDQVAATDDGTSNAGRCEGKTIDLLAAIADPACRILEADADRLREALEDPAKTPLRIDAVVTQGALRQLSIVNTGSSPAELPLLVHTHLDAFPAKAGSLVLAPPEPAWPPGTKLETGRTFAKVVLAPGGRAFANLRLHFENLTVVASVVPDCPPNAKCAPRLERRPLPPNTYTLRFRTPLYASRADLEARLRWTTGRAPCPKPAPCKPGEHMVPGCPGGVRPRPDDCPSIGHCAPGNVPVEACRPRP